MWPRGDRIIGIAALVLMVSVFTDWYTGSGVGVQLAVIGWHTGLLGKLVFALGLVILAILVLREFGIDLIPASAPEKLVFLGLGALASALVLSAISVPSSMLPASSRGVGLWISLLASFAVIAGGLLRASEEL